MVSSSVEICNLALDYLGTGNIISLDEQFNDNAKLCKRWYDVTRKSLLKDLNASFAIKEELLLFYLKHLFMEGHISTNYLLTV